MARGPRLQRARQRPNQSSKKSLVKVVSNRKRDTNPQLALIFACSPHFERSQPLPYEIMLKIFHEIIRTSDNPIKELCNLADVCEAWRVVILNTPSLWSRINFNQIPLTDGNFKVISVLFDRLPAITRHVREASLCGPLLVKNSESLNLLEKILTAPKFDELTIDRLDPQNRMGSTGQVCRAISKSHQLRRLTIKNTKAFFNSQKWISDYISENGRHLEELHLTSSLTTVSHQLHRALASDFCPSLRVLDLSTCVFLCDHSVDAVTISQTMPNLVVLRVANVSFRRVRQAPERFGLPCLEELSMPINARDADRDDALFATLAYGSERISTLDLRGSCISAYALLDMPANNIRELHIDDISPITRKFYGPFVERWRYSLRVLSLVKINCSKTIKDCLEALVKGGESYIREIDMESSDVTEEDLRSFLKQAKSLETINLSSCRSLPRGCKGRYSNRYCSDNTAQSLTGLLVRMGVIDTHSESETEIDEESSKDSLEGRLPIKRRRVAKKRPDYVTVW